MSYKITHLQRQSKIYKPLKLTIDSNNSNNNIYISQNYYRCIIKIDANGNIIDTIGNTDNIIGDIDGSFENSRFNYISDICCDSFDNLYILDSSNNKIKYANMNTRQVTTFLDNFYNLNNIVIDVNDNLYVSDYNFNPPDFNTIITNIYKISNDALSIPTPLIQNLFNCYGYTLDYNKYSNLYVNNYDNVNNNNVVSIYDLNGNKLSNINLTFQPFSICHYNDYLYFTIFYSSQLYNVNIYNHSINLYSSSTGGFLNSTILNSQYNLPQKIIIQNNIIYLTDMFNNMIRKIDISGNIVSTIIGSLTRGMINGNIYDAMFDFPQGLTYKNDDIFICDSYNNQIRKYNTNTNLVSLYSGDPDGEVGNTTNPPRYSAPQGICIDNNNNIYIANFINGNIKKIDTNENVTVIAEALNYPSDIKIDSNNNIFITNSGGNNIIKISNLGINTIFAGDLNGDAGYINDIGLNARFNFPYGIIINSKDEIFVSELYNNIIRKITQNSEVTTFCGLYGNGGYQDGNANSALFLYPARMAIDSNDNIYLCDSNNGMIRKINPNGFVTTIVSNYRSPLGITLFNNDLYVSDNISNQISKIELIHVPCLLYNTDILIYSSEGNIIKKIQDITEDDFVIGTKSKKPIKVLFSGYKIVDIDKLNEYTYPTKIPKDLFDKNIPSNDLYISNNHLIYLEKTKNNLHKKRDTTIINQDLLTKLNITKNNIVQKKNVINSIINKNKCTNYIYPYEINEIKDNSIKTIEEIENITGLNQLRFYHIMIEDDDEGFYANNIPVESLKTQNINGYIKSNEFNKFNYSYKNINKSNIQFNIQFERFSYLHRE
jgi:sugar lactone lactonase YvrE